MKNHLVSGIVLAVAAAASVLLSAVLGLDLVDVTVLGVALGAALVVISDRSVAGRLIGFGLGVVVAWLAYGLRAGVLPDSDTGRAVAFAATFVLVGLIATVSGGRLPMWSLLIGVAAMTGAYEAAFGANTPLFTSESVVALTSVLLTSLVGFVAATLVAGPRTDEANVPQHRDMEEARA